MTEKSLPSGRIHTSREPNIQNIPLRTPEGQKIKEAFIKALKGEKRD